MASDSNDSSFPQMELRFVNSCNFKDVEGRGIQEIERNKGSDPNSFMNTRQTPASITGKKGVNN